jgi:hypothetical protein
MILDEHSSQTHLEKNSYFNLIMFLQHEKHTNYRAFKTNELQIKSPVKSV